MYKIIRVILIAVLILVVFLAIIGISDAVSENNIQVHELEDTIDSLKHTNSILEEKIK